MRRRRSSSREISPAASSFWASLLSGVFSRSISPPATMVTEAPVRSARVMAVRSSPLRIMTARGPMRSMTSDSAPAGAFCSETVAPSRRMRWAPSMLRKAARRSPLLTMPR